MRGPGLEGTGRVADDVWLLAHDDVTGKPYIQPRPLGLGAAGGLLAELALAGAVSVRSETISVLPVRSPPPGALLLRVLRHLEAEREDHPAGEWLRYLARTAPTEVAKRLEADGYVARTGRWLPWRPDRWVPADRDGAFSPMLRVRAALDASRPLNEYAGVLTGLAEACGLGFRFAQYAPAHARSAEQVIAQLHPILGDLITQTRTAVDSAILAHRV
jgi:hypothetical protein